MHTVGKVGRWGILRNNGDLKGDLSNLLRIMCFTLVLFYFALFSTLHTILGIILLQDGLKLDWLWWRVKLS